MFRRNRLAAKKEADLPLLLTMGILAGLLFSYTAARAVMLSFTHDESFTWIHYVQLPLTDILWFAAPSGNNHLLNTLLMKGCSLAGGDSEWVLRLPNLAGHLLYLGFSIAILRRIRNPWVRLFGFLLLNLNPFLLDFFSLARGYGISLGLMMGSLYWFLRWISHPKLRNLLLALLFLIPATLANITLVPCFIACWITALALRIPGVIPGENPLPAKQWIAVNLSFLAAGVLLTAFLWLPLSRMIEANRIDYGGTTGFWTDSVVSLIKKSCYGMSYRHLATEIFSTIWGISLIAGFLLWIRSLVRRKEATPFPPSLLLFLLLFLLTAIGWILQFHLFGTPYLMSRTALSLWPLMAFILTLMLDHPKPGSSLRPYTSLAAGFLSIPLMINFLLVANVTHTLEWRFDADTKAIATYLERQRPVRPTLQVTIACSWIYEPTLNYYRLSQGYSWFAAVDRRGPFIPSDFQVVIPEDADSLKKLNAIPLMRYPVSGSVLLQRP